MSHEISTRVLLKQIAQGDGNDNLTFELLLDSFRRRSYGLFLLIVLLPVFIPIPFGQGGVSGLLTSLFGLQLLIQFEHPWLPKFIGDKPFKRQNIIKFVNRFDTWLCYMEKFCKPRWEYVFDHAWARVFSGLLLIILGVLLALPIPLTNYPFGVIVLCFSLGFIERDGILLSIGWILGIIEIAILAEFSSYAFDFIAYISKYFT